MMKDEPRFDGARVRVKPLVLTLPRSEGEFRAVALHFAYDAALVAFLKQQLHRYRDGGRAIGGWEPSRRARWVALDAWPRISMILAGAGVLILDGSDGAVQRERGQLRGLAARARR